MNRTMLQVPVDASLRVAAEKAAKEMGFSSLQEAVRVFLKQLVNGSLTFRFEEKKASKKNH